MFKIVIHCGIMFHILHKPKTNNFASESFVRIVHRFVAHTGQDNEDIYFLLLGKFNYFFKSNVKLLSLAILINFGTQHT